MAKSIVNTYLAVFQDKNTQIQKLGEGFYILYSKILNRNNNLNRPENRLDLSKGLGVKCNFNLLNWVTNSDFENVDPNEILVKKQEAEKDFVSTFSYQRKFLNVLETPPSIEEIQDMWTIDGSLNSQVRWGTHLMPILYFPLRPSKAFHDQYWTFLWRNFKDNWKAIFTGSQSFVPKMCCKFLYIHVFTHILLKTCGQNLSEVNLSFI